MHSVGSMYSCSAVSKSASPGFGWMQSTGQTSMHESSLMQLPVITYVMPRGYLPSPGHSPTACVALGRPLLEGTAVPALNWLSVLAARLGHAGVGRPRRALEPALLVRRPAGGAEGVEAGVPVESEVVLDADAIGRDAAADLAVVLRHVDDRVRGVDQRVQLAVVLREGDRVHPPGGGVRADRRPAVDEDLRMRRVPVRCVDARR